MKGLIWERMQGKGEHGVLEPGLSGDGPGSQTATGHTSEGRDADKASGRDATLRTYFPIIGYTLFSFYTERKFSRRVHFYEFWSSG